MQRFVSTASNFVFRNCTGSSLEGLRIQGDGACLLTQAGPARQQQEHLGESAGAASEAACWWENAWDLLSKCDGTGGGGDLAAIPKRVWLCRLESESELQFSAAVWPVGCVGGFFCCFSYEDKVRGQVFFVSETVAPADELNSY